MILTNSISMIVAVALSACTAVTTMSEEIVYIT